jgi:plastocyanin
MKRFLTAVAVVLVSAAVGTAVRAGSKDGDTDKDKAVAVQNVVVDFGQPQPQGAVAAATHFLQPVGGKPDGEATISKGGTVTFRVNGGGHGVSVYRVSKNTTRADIIAVGSPDGLCPTRSAASCGTAFANLAHVIRDGEGEIVVDAGANPPFARVDDAERILVGTAALIPDGVVNGVQTQVAGIFAQGTNAVATPTNPIRTVAEQIRVKFTKNGRYLVICMNRNHSINDHMFSFVNVVGDNDD